MHPEEHLDDRGWNSNEMTIGDNVSIMDAVRPYFDASYYLSRYDDIKNVGVDPLAHFCEHG